VLKNELKIEFSRSNAVIFGTKLGMHAVEEEKCKVHQGIGIEEFSQEQFCLQVLVQALLRYVENKIGIGFKNGFFERNTAWLL
jgi:hypothetical protein